MHWLGLGGLSIAAGLSLAVISALVTVVYGNLPYSHPRSLVQISVKHRAAKGALGLASWPDFLDWRSRCTAFASLDAYEADTFRTQIRGAYFEVNAIVLTSNLLPSLGVRPELGAFWPRTADEGSTGQAAISYHLWRHRFGGRHNVIGTRFRLGGRRFVVDAVMPAGFSFPPGPAARDVWAGPSAEGLTPSPPERTRNLRFLHVFGRLNTGVTESAAAAQLGAVVNELAHSHPVSDGGVESVSVRSARDVLVGDARKPLWFLLAASLLLLALTSSNCAGFEASRSSQVRQRSAIAKALGATTGRIITETAREAALIGAAVAISGGTLAWAALAVFRRLGPASIPRLAESRFNVTTAAACAAVGAVCTATLLAAVLPAVLSAGTPDLAFGTSGKSSLSHRRGLRIIAVFQIASTLVLVWAGIALAGAFARVASTSTGFTTRGVFAFEIDPGGTGPPASQLATYGRAIAAARDLPWVAAAGAGSPVPLGAARNRLFLSPNPRAGDTHQVEVNAHVLTPGYFRTLGIRLLAGRSFSGSKADGTGSMIVDRRLLHTLGGPSHLGSEVELRLLGGGAPQIRKIVGVVSNVDDPSLAPPTIPDVYVPESLFLSAFPTILVRTAGKRPPSGWQAGLRNAELAAVPAAPVFEIKSLSSEISALRAPERFELILVWALALIASLSAAACLAASLALILDQRRKDLAIRQALGAPPRALVSTVVGPHVVSVVAGLVFGSLAASAASAYVSTRLEWLGTIPAWPICLSVCAVSAVAAASAVPSVRRAYRFDAADVLRQP